MTATSSPASMIDATETRIRQDRVILCIRLADRAAVPEDIPVLSDLLLTRPLGQTDTSLEEALGGALIRPLVGSSERFAVAWEVSGLGLRT